MWSFKCKGIRMYTSHLCIHVIYVYTPSMYTSLSLSHLCIHLSLYLIFVSMSSMYPCHLCIHVIYVYISLSISSMYPSHELDTHIAWATYIHPYEVATMSRLSKNIALFCKRALQKRLYPAEETYIFKEPTNHSHPICHLQSQHMMRHERWSSKSIGSGQILC